VGALAELTSFMSAPGCFQKPEIGITSVESTGVPVARQASDYAPKMKQTFPRTSIQIKNR